MTFPWPFAILVKIPWLFQKFQKISKFQKFHDFSMTVATLCWYDFNDLLYPIWSMFATAMKLNMILTNMSCLSIVIKGNPIALGQSIKCHSCKLTLPSGFLPVMRVRSGLMTSHHFLISEHCARSSTQTNWATSDVLGNVWPSRHICSTWKLSQHLTATYEKLSWDYYVLRAIPIEVRGGMSPSLEKFCGWVVWTTLRFHGWVV